MHTQGSRRVKFGLNVAVVVVAATLIVIVLNWIGYRQYWRMDLTKGGKYSLSEQTLKVLKQLDGDYRIVSILPPAEMVEPPLDSIIQQATDVINEYARRAKNITVEELTPRDITRIDGFYESLNERYESQLAPVRQSVEAGLKALARVRDEAPQLGEPLTKLIEGNALPDGELKQFVAAVAQAFARFGSQIESIERSIERALDGPLPDYGQARSTLTSLLGDLDSGVFEVALNRFQQAAKDSQTPADVRNTLNTVVAGFEAMHEQIRDTKQKLDGAQTVEDYDKLNNQLSSPETVVVVGPEQVQVIPLNELFRPPDRAQMQPGQTIPELRFQGEEKITGALFSMSMKQPPMVVFMGGGQRPLTGPGGTYQQVAQRLRNINFQVEQWSPMGRPGPMGQPMPPGPVPEPKAGQKAVWVVTPSPPADPRNPMAQQGPQQLLSTVKDRLGKGDGVFFLVAYNPMPFMGGGEEIKKLLEPWGINAQTDRAVLSEVRLANQQSAADYRFDMGLWPQTTPITAPLDGMLGHFELPSPLELTKPEGAEANVWPLVEVSGSRMWAESDLQTQQRPEFKQETAADSFVIAAAAQKDNSRIVVVTASHDPAARIRGWAADATTSVGPWGPGTAEALGAVWPANAELFVNSVFWLAGMDELIAASARTQDVRRVSAITNEGLTGLRWTLMAGLPLATFGAGIGVWLARRKG